VYANNFTVSIDQSVAVNSLKKISNTTPSIAAGGGFTVTAAATVNITAGIQPADNAANSTALLTINAGSASVTITAAGGIYGGAAGFGRTAVKVSASHSGSIIINAGITGKYGNGVSVDFSSTASITVNGNIASDAASGDTGVLMNGGSITVNGNITGGSGYALDGGGANTVTVVGNVTGGSSAGINGAGSTVMDITGDVTGGSGAPGISFGLADGSATIRGNIYCGEGSPGYANPGIQTYYSGTTGQVRISGHLWAGGTSSDGAEHGCFPVVGPFVKITGEDLTIHLLDDTGFPSNAGGTAVTYTPGGGGGSSRPATGYQWPRSN